MSDYEVRMKEMAARRFQDRIDSVSHQLRELADKVEREGYAPGNLVGVADHAWKASQVVHAVTWALANLNLGALVEASSEADAAELALRRYEDERADGATA